MNKTGDFLKLLDETSNWEQDPQGAVDKVDAFLKKYPKDPTPGALELKASAQELIYKREYIKFLDEVGYWREDPQGAVDKANAFLKKYPETLGAIQIKDAAQGLIDKQELDKQGLIDKQEGGKPLKSRKRIKGSRTKRTRTKRSRKKRMRTKRTRTKLSRVKRRGNLRRNTRRR